MHCKPREIFVEESLACDFLFFQHPKKEGVGKLLTDFPIETLLSALVPLVYEYIINVLCVKHSIPDFNTYDVFAISTNCWLSLQSIKQNLLFQLYIWVIQLKMKSKGYPRSAQLTLG